jgi:hypothetical protein
MQHDTEKIAFMYLGNSIPIHDETLDAMMDKMRA